MLNHHCFSTLIPNMPLVGAEKPGIKLCGHISYWSMLIVQTYHEITEIP
jgi:hypothetical protein